MTELLVEPAGVPRALAMLERAEWASRSFARYDAASVRRIAEAVALAGAEHAEEFARLAVEETGFGVVEHKVRKNTACSVGIVETYRDEDFVSVRVDHQAPSRQPGGEALGRGQQLDGGNATSRRGEARRAPSAGHLGGGDECIEHTHAVRVAYPAECWHDARAMSHLVFAFDAKKKPWRPSRKARALGL